MRGNAYAAAVPRFPFNSALHEALLFKLHPCAGGGGKQGAVGYVRRAALRQFALNFDAFLMHATQAI